MGICNDFYKHTICLVILLTYFDNIIYVGRIHDIWMIKNIVLNNILQMRINIWQFSLLNITYHSVIPPHKKVLPIHTPYETYFGMTIDDIKMMRKIVALFYVYYWSSLLSFFNCSKICLTGIFITICCWNNTNLNNMFILFLIMGKYICSI